MRSKVYFGVAAALVCFLSVVGLASAQDEAATEQVGAAAQAVPDPTSFVTQHSGQFNGEQISYTVTAGETYLRDEDGEPKAAIFTFAYTKDDVAEGEVRPVTFIWNGGPGSASLWLHMGTFGPRRVAVPSNAEHAGTPPYPVVDAPETILDVTDLVFVDPVGTGFSKAVGDHEGKEFWGLTEDAQSIAEFIRDWVTEHGRWNSPKFLLGESYGTTRAAAVARILEGRFMLRLNGIVFVSQALDYAGSSPYIGDNLISYITYVPSMAATAAYHDRIDPAPASLEVFLQEARAFAVEELLPALFQGNRLDTETRDHVRDRLAYFTGLSPEYVERANLRVNGSRFLKELLRDQGLAAGRLDSRYTRDDIDDLSTNTESDAASDAISAAYKAALMDYMHRDLEVRWDRLYQAPADRNLGSEWRWQSPSAEPWPVNTARDLSSALRSNPQLRVMVASGYYDFATPFFDAEYTLNRHDIPADRIDYKYYAGGHMMYVNEPSRLQLLEDVRGFIEGQLNQQ